MGMLTSFYSLRLILLISEKTKKFKNWTKRHV